MKENKKIEKKEIKKIVIKNVEPVKTLICHHT